jgi:AAA domain/Primase C terminal 2 (PriCT-2)
VITFPHPTEASKKIEFEHAADADMYRLTPDKPGFVKSHKHRVIADDDWGLAPPGDIVAQPAPKAGRCFGPIAVTFFPDVFAISLTSERKTLHELRDMVLNTTARAKDHLPLVKLADFGDARKPSDKQPPAKWSLRHDGNVITISGVELDYDGEKISFAEAVEKIESAKLRALLYTSPSHTDDKPRWRIILPTSIKLPTAERERLAARVNGLFGGVMSPESFTLSQAYYYGRVANKPTPLAEIVEGDFIDDRADLDAGAIGKRSEPKAEKAEPKGEPVITSPEQGAAILAALPASAYRTGESWREVVWAFAEGTGNAPWAREQIDAWSKTDPEYYEGDAVAVFDRNNADRDKPIGVATLFRELKLHGRADLIPRKVTDDDRQREFVLLTDFAEADLPPRDYIVADLLERGNVGIIAGQGGASKSTLSLLIAIAVSSGKDIGPFKPTKKYKVGMINAEDDVTEQRRRLAALLKSKDVVNRPRDLFGSLEIHTLQCDLTRLVAMNPDTRKVEATNTYRWLCAEIRRLELDIVFIDPLIEVTEGVNENDNAQMHGVMALLRSLARALNVHVCIVHHFNKPGEANNPGAVRGGSSILNAARMVLNLEKLNDADCKKYRITDGERHCFIKMVAAKANNTPTGATHYFKLAPIELENGDTVAAIEPVHLERGTATTATVIEFLKRVQAGRTDKPGWLFTLNTEGPKAGRADCLMTGVDIDTVRVLVDRGYLKMAEFQGAGRHKKQGIEVVRFPDPTENWDPDPFEGGEQ